MKLSTFFKKLSPRLRYIYIVATVVFLTGVGLLIWFGAGAFFGRLTAAERAALDSTPAAAPSEALCVYRRRVNGACVPSALGVDPELVAVMIENSRDAWPLSGLSEAAVVYEAPVEGNVPRFLAIYVGDDPVTAAGPVRSVRPYYVDWVSEYGDIMYMHVGGSDEGLERMDAANVFAINEFYRDGYFWRSGERPRPHNTYTSSRLWQKARKDYGEYHESEAYDGWLFAERRPCGSASNSDVNEECVSEITAAFLSPTYDARWVYNTSTEKYSRYQNKELQTDPDGAAIAADTVIVQRVRAAVIDEVGRKRLDTIGEGEVTVFRNGYAIPGRWRKASRKDRTQFYDENDQLIPLQSGKIWVEVLPVNGKLETRN